MLTEIVSPKKIILSDNFKFIILPGEEGDLGVFDNHTPTVTTLRLGLVFLYKEDKIFKRFLVHNGVCEITKDKCTILSENIEDINENLIKELRKNLVEEPDNQALIKKINVIEKLYYN